MGGDKYQLCPIVYQNFISSSSGYLDIINIISYTIALKISYVQSVPSCFFPEYSCFKFSFLWLTSSQFLRVRSKDFASIANNGHHKNLILNWPRYSLFQSFWYLESWIPHLLSFKLKPHDQRVKRVATRAFKKSLFYLKAVFFHISINSYFFL